MNDIFLSYSRDDQATARRFAEAFEREGLTVWWDQSLRAGEVYDRVTEKALQDAKAVVVLWSRKSVESHWVRSEATQAQTNGTLVPVMIEPCKRPIMFELMHTAEMAQWKGDAGDPAWKSFLGDVRQFVKKEGVEPSPVLASQPVAMRKNWKSPAMIGIGIAALLIIGAGVWMLTRTGAKMTNTQVTGQTAPGNRPAVVATDASVAVLPFKDMSSAKDQEYFADGVTEEILNSLAGLHDLKVTGRTSSFAFKGKDVDLRTIGETLGVKNILEGSVRKSGKQLRITAQLNDAKTGYHLWSKTYERPMDDIFKIQEDIATSVAQALQVSLGVGFGNQPGMTRDVEAYDTFLAAGPLIVFQNPESQRRAIGLLEQAVARDPAFVNAWIQLFDAYGRMSVFVTDDPQVWKQKADTALGNARRLAPDSLSVRLALARVSADQNHWIEAAGQLEDLKTESARVGVSGIDPRGVFFLMVGRTREALAALEQEKARDPLNPYVSFMLAVTYSSVRNFPASIAEFKRGYPLDPSMQYLFRLGALSNALATRDREEIRRQQIQISSAPGARPELGTELTRRLDRPSDALAYLQKQVQDPSIPIFQMAGISQWLAYFGDPKTALEAHRRALEHGVVMPASLSIWYPGMSDVRKLPEFKLLVRDIGLVEYWRKYGWGDFCKPVGKDDFECH